MRAKLISASIATLSTLSCSLAGVRLNLTGSMPVGLYVQVHAPPTRGAIALVCLPPAIAQFASARGYVPNGRCPGGVAPVGKPIVAVAGDTVVVSAEGLRVQGRLVLNSVPLQSDLHGLTLPALARGAYVVRPHELWLLSSHSRRSFDSRYFGAVSDTRVIAVIRPMAIW